MISNLDIFSLENKMERIATAYFKEKKYVEESLLKESEIKMNALAKEYDELAREHFYRNGQFSNYCYYVI